MMNRSVMGRQMFQEGGMAMPDPMAEAMPMDPAMGANPEPPSNLDENMVNEAMMAASQDFGSLDDVDDYEGMINAIRGDQAPMAERVNELADMVGLEDAQQTPDSVVALLQPVMLLNSMDQGIGSIAEGVMDTEMSGDMTGGIMSTVNMEPPMDPAMAQPMPMDPGMDPGMGMPMEMGVGNEPPVNFRQGGAVQYFAPENEERVVQPGSLTANFAERQELYNSLIPPQSYDESDAQRQREMTQAQMLFDVAGTALAFATPGSTQMSPAQRLAEAATETQLFDKIGARAQNQMDSEKARKNSMRDEKMKMDLLALQSAESMTTAQAKARSDLAGKTSDLITLYNPATKDEINIRKDQVGEIDRLQTDGYRKRTTPSIDDGSKTTSNTRITLYNSGTGKQINPLASDRAGIDEAMEDGFTVITTPSKPERAALSEKIQFISDSGRLTSYANGTIDPSEKNQLESTLLEMQIPTTRMVNGVSVTSPAIPFSRSVQDAIRARIRLNLPTSNFNLPEREAKTTSAALDQVREAQDLPSKIAVFSSYTNKNTGVLPRDLLNSTEFNKTLLNESGSVNLNSDGWTMVPTLIYNAKGDLEYARGLGTVYDRTTSMFSAIARDVTGQPNVDTAGKFVYQADNDFKALKLQTQSVLTNTLTENRVLKSVQDSINELLKPLDPGIFGVDEKTLFALSSINAQLGTALTNYAAILPEYGGDPTSASNKEIGEARRDARKTRTLIGEYTQFIAAMERVVSLTQTQGGRAGDPDLRAKKQSLFNLMQEGKSQ